MRPLPSIDTLRATFRYEPDTGRLFWRARNRNLTGVEAGSVDPGHGYRRVPVERRLHLVHRIALAMVNGEWPDGEVDHINGDRSDNRLENLRAVSKSDNVKNKALYRNNKSGVPGVSWHKQHRKWCARIQKKTIGVFRDIEDAVAARRAAEREREFHSNHGRDGKW